jgi:hypothetical protein
VSKTYPWPHRESTVDLSQASPEVKERIEELQQELEAARAAYFGLRERYLIDRIAAVDGLRTVCNAIQQYHMTGALAKLAKQYSEWIDTRQNEGWA